jgi:tripartite-type tricarboxylate transporter receptor subunit TctC
MLNKKITIFLLFGILLIAIFSVPCLAEEYPNKEIKIIIPWVAGGGTDLISRFIANKLEDKLGVPVVVINTSGGAGLVGYRTIAAADPDGYTIGAVSTSLLLHKPSGVEYIEWKEKLTPIIVYNEDPAALTVAADAPWDTLEEFISYAKDNPGEIRIANAGPAGIWHIAALIFAEKADLSFKHIPYEGGRPAAVAVAGRHIEATTVSPAEVAPLVDAGELKVLSIFGAERSSLFPDVPTAIEEGYDIVSGPWRGFMGPAGMPKDAVSILESSVEEIIKTQEYADFLEKGGFGFRYMNSEEFRKFLEQSEIEMEKLFEDIEL